MIWRKCEDSDKEDFLRLTQEPMGGKVKLSWGLNSLRCPPECQHLRAYTIVTKTGITGCSMAWDWPGGHRYLNGLRFAHEMQSRPLPKFWTHAFESLLQDVELGWTSIGKTNTRARRILESKVPWLPRYVPQQEITTWFVPLPSCHARESRNIEMERENGITPLDWRYIAITSGSGLAYNSGRLLHRMGQPGVPKSGHPLRVADYRPSLHSDPNQIRMFIKEIRGFDGLVIVLPNESELSKKWIQVCPRLAWTWQSTLYSLSWKRDNTSPEVPDWKGYWL